MTDHRSRAPDAGPVREDLSFDHGAVSAFNAWFLTAFGARLDQVARHHKRSAFAGIDAAVVLEIGAGTGANAAYIEPGTHVYAVEPSRRMHERLRRRYADARIDVTVLATGAEAIPLPDASVDEVICSLVLCTVRDVDSVLAEIRRVLRPGGRFRFVEHVAAAGRIRGAVQRAVRRPWGWLFEGCDPHRRTPAAIRNAGFASVHLEDRVFPYVPFLPVNSAVWGIAVR